MQTISPASSAMVQDLTALLGKEAVMADAGDLALWCEDIGSTVEPCVAVVFPTTTEQVQAAVRFAAEHGLKVVPRGSGLSYTSGYLPTDPRSIMIDLTKMARVIEFNAEDMYITAEAGCTWATIRETLRGTGLMPPYWGPLSGLESTVGGAASQNSIFFGAAAHGTASETILSLEVVLADGSVIHTGTAANRDGTPFFRHYGPNLAGVFIGDTGAMGVKTKVTLQLVRVKPIKRFVSFEMPDRNSTVDALSAIARTGVAIECYGMDPTLQRQRLRRESILKDVKALASVIKSSGSILSGLKEGGRMALAGRSFVDEAKWSLHAVIEADCAESGELNVAEVSKIATGLGGIEIENTIPKVMHASPFGPPNSMIGPNGERWIPVHGLVPHSRTKAVFDEIEALFEANADKIREYQVDTGFFTICVGPSAINIEPVFWWPDELKPMHRRRVEQSVLSKVDKHPPAPEAEAFVMELRSACKHIFRRAGGTHFQIGKSYPLKDGMEDSSWALLSAIKAAIDPENRINPGSLGL